MHLVGLLAGVALCALSVGALASTSEISPGCMLPTQFLTVTVTAPSLAPDGSDVAYSTLADAALASLSTISGDHPSINYTVASVTAAPSSASPNEQDYYYVVVDGTTSWLNGRAPPSTVSSRNTKTVQVTVYPVAASGSTATVLHTQDTAPSSPAPSSPAPSSTDLDNGVTVSAPASNSSAALYLAGSGLSAPTFPSDRASQTVTATADPARTTRVSTVKAPIFSGRPYGSSPYSRTNVSSRSSWRIFSHGTSLLTSVNHVSTMIVGNVTRSAMSTISSPTAPATNHTAQTTRSMSQITPWSTASLNGSGRAHPPSTARTSGTSIAAISGRPLPSLSTVVVGTGGGPAFPSGLSRSMTVLTTLIGTSATNTSTAFATGQAPTLTATVLSITSSVLTPFYTNSTSTGSITRPTPKFCGEHGDFVLNWDDEPTFSPTDPITDPSEAPPVFNPYHHMYFSNGYVYAPPPRDPFPPISGSRLVMFLTNETGPSNNPNAGGQRPGEIGAGDRASESAFWFNVYSAYLGCDNAGPHDCNMLITGYVWQADTQDEVLVFQQAVSLPPCPGFQNCKLQPITFAKSMVNLSGIQIQASVDGEERMWYMDDLAMGWSNNTCAAGLLRLRSQ